MYARGGPPPTTDPLFSDAFEQNQLSPLIEVSYRLGETISGGRIVSNHAKRIITQFMAACGGKSKTEDAIVGQASMEPNEDEKNQPCAMSLLCVHQVLKEAANPKSD